MDKKEYHKLWRQKNVLKIQQYKKLWRQKNKLKIYNDNKAWQEKNREKTRASSLNHYYNHKEERTAYSKQYRQTHKRQIYHKTRTWQMNNPEKTRLYTWERLIRIKNICHLFTYEEWMERLLSCNNICPLCEKEAKLQLDHIFPVSKAQKGRKYTIDDVQPLCKSCNCEKSAKI